MDMIEARERMAVLEGKQYSSLTHGENSSLESILGESQQPKWLGC